MLRKHVGFLTLVAAGALAACGDDPLSVGDALSEAEAAALSEAVFASAMSNTDTPQPAVVGGPQAAPMSIEQDVELTGQCELGGTVDVDGSVAYQGDTETNEFSLEYSVTLDHHGCVVEAGSNEQVFTLDGVDDLTFQFSLTTGQDSFDLDGGLEGRIAWQSDERSGECGIDISFSGDGAAFGEAVAGSFSLEGQICGNAIDSSLTIN